MAGGKRMRFRACVAIGNRKGKIGLGLAKGADVSMAINKAVNKAKKDIVDVKIYKNSIPHIVKLKYGAARIILKPSKEGRGIICGGVMRIIMDLAGVNNITGKILGTNNKVNNAKCIIRALRFLKTNRRISGNKEEIKEENKETKEESK
jgi:small subunit ribosomal protein S5